MRIGVTVLVDVVITLHHLRSHHVEYLLAAFLILEPPNVDRVGEEILETDLLVVPCDLLHGVALMSGDLLGPLHPPRDVFLHGPLTLISIDCIDCVLL